LGDAPPKCCKSRKKAGGTKEVSKTGGELGESKRIRDPFKKSEKKGSKGQSLWRRKKTGEKI